MHYSCLQFEKLTVINFFHLRTLSLSPKMMMEALLHLNFGTFFNALIKIIKVHLQAIHLQHLDQVIIYLEFYDLKMQHNIVLH